MDAVAVAVIVSLLVLAGTLFIQNDNLRAELEMYRAHHEKVQIVSRLGYDPQTRRKDESDARSS